MVIFNSYGYVKLPEGKLPGYTQIQLWEAIV